MEQYFSPEELEYINETRNKPAVENWLSQFAAEDIPVFLAHYHRQRSNWLNIGSYELKKKHDWLTIDMERAETVLFFIQQKKLFDLQCLWRAEQVEIPGIEHAAEFEDLEENIRSLDMLAPITEDELELLKKWLTDYTMSRRLYPEDGWQKYKRYVRNNKEREDGSLPNLYNYMDFQTGTTSLWKLLPDIRGQKEEKYIFAAMDVRARFYKAQTPETVLNHRPKFYVNDRKIIEFASAFEDHNTNQCRIAYDETAFHCEDHDLNFAIETLEHAQEPVAMDAHKDWRAAIKYAAWKYERKRLLPSLDVAFENYRFRLQMGIGFAPKKEKNSSNGQISDSEGWRKEILDGREELGEPRDFNF